MPHIVIISASVRIGRKSHRTALFFQNFLKEYNLATSEILDLMVYNFPLFDERLQYLQNPLPSLVEFADKIRAADGVIIVTPEYNGGYPASLKNIIDALTNDWRRKPVAISTNSDGVFGGMQVITSLQYSLWKIRTWTVPAMFPVRKVQETFDESGVPVDKADVEKRAKGFIDELLWCIEAAKRMKDNN